MRCVRVWLFAALLIVAGCDSGGGVQPEPEPEPEPEPNVTLPEAAFSASPTTITAGDTVSFTNESTDATSWAWDFGDESTSTKENPVHVYADPGSYTVSLTATNDDGEDTETKADFITVTAKPEPPTAAFSADSTTIIVGGTVSFTDESTGEPTSWEWTFGDGGTSTEQSPEHTYTETGTYTVSLTATNEAGSNTETKADYITVEPEPMPPDAAFTASETTVFIADTISFTDESTNSPSSWEWDFDDGTTSDEQNPKHVYTEAGDYWVTLTATNADGSDTATNRITVEPKRAYSVKYQADATFAECTVTYYNDDGGVTQTDVAFEEGPWTLEFDVVAEEFDTPLVGFGLGCSDFEEEHTASAELIINGDTFISGEESGTYVSFDLDAELTLDGAKEW